MTQYTYGLTRMLGHGHAFTQRLVVPNPAAGAAFTIPADSRYWRVFDLIAFRLVTSSHTANRQVVLTYLDGDGVAIATLPSASTQAATLTYDYTWSTEFSNFNTVVGGAVTSPLPFTLLPPGFSAAVTIGSEDTGDQVSNIRVMSEQFVTGNEGYVIGVTDTLLDPVAELAAVAAIGS